MAIAVMSMFCAAMASADNSSECVIGNGISSLNYATQIIHFITVFQWIGCDKEHTSCVKLARNAQRKKCFDEQQKCVGKCLSEYTDE